MYPNQEILQKNILFRSEEYVRTVQTMKNDSYPEVQYLSATVLSENSVFQENALLTVATQ